MFFNLLKYELNYRRKMISNHIYFLVFFLLAFLSTIASGGSFQGVKISIGMGSDKVMVNSPLNIHTMIAALCFVGILIIGAVAAKAILRDYETGAYQWFYSLPVSKFSYIGSRFTGALITCLYIFSSVGIGIWLASIMPFVMADRFTANHLINYLYPYLVSVIPFLIFTLALFVGISLWLRTTLSIMVSALLIIMGYGLMMSLSVDLDDNIYKALFDPMGLYNISYQIRYWSVDDKNTLLIPFSGAFLYNKLIFMGLGFLILGFAYSKFNFSYFLAAGKAGKPQKEAEKVEKLTIPLPVIRFSNSILFKNLISMTWHSFIGLIKSGPFMVIMLAWALQSAMNAKYIGSMFETTIHPITIRVLETLSGQFMLFAIAILTIYSGEIVFRERERKFDGIYNALPVPTGTILFSKIGALFMLTVFFMLAILLMGISIQLCLGHTDLELTLYLKYLFGTKLIGYLLLAVLAFTLQILINNKYIGYLAMTGYYLSTAFLAGFDFNHVLYTFDSGSTGYSDITGFGRSFYFIIMKSYWLTFGLLLLTVAYLFFTRGNETGFKQRVKIAKQRFTGKLKLFTAGAATAFILLGGFIFYNTNILHEYNTNKTLQQQRVEYEKKYKKMERTYQPEVVETKLSIDLYPSEEKLVSTGYQILKNIYSKPIDTLIVNFDTDSKYSVTLDRKATPLVIDKLYGLEIYKLDQPLQQGDSLRLDYKISFTGRGFNNDGTNQRKTRVNGTFTNNMEIVPLLGYNSGVEISDNATRKQYGLPDKERMADSSDTFSRNHNYVGGWTRYEATVSTEGDQTAVMPGKLVKKWQADGRNYFNYKIEQPILNFFNINSARYAVKTGKWQNVDLEIYYHPTHGYNLERMQSSMQKSLDYLTKNFGPYPFPVLRIMEFPGGSYAQSFATSIAFSENVGFLADLDSKREKGVDYMLNITAHEIAHQWWAHQVISANVRGATVLTEVLAQYSCLMVLEKNSKPAEVRTFLKHSMDNYLQSRGAESEKELALTKSENQGYLHYDKGVVVMNAIKDYIGEEKVNQALRSLLAAKSYARPPYPVSRELTDRLLEVTPDSLKYLITDSFDKIVFYNNKAVAATTAKLNSGKYLTKISVECKKFEADSLGKEKPLVLNDYLEIGVLDKDGNPLATRLCKLTKEKNNFEIQSDAKPAKAGLDPLVKLIDRNSKDNAVEVTEK